MESVTPETVVVEEQVDAGLAGQRLDQAAAALFPDYSRARLQQWIRERALTVDGAAGRPSQRLAGGEWLRLEARLEEDTEVVAQPIPLQVLFEDEHLLVVEKPANLVVHPAAGHPDGTLQNALLHHRPALAALPRAGIVHRLDKDTSGVMVVAASLKAHASLVDQLQTRDMSRIYDAVVHGITPAEGEVNEPIGRHPRDRKRMAVVRGGKPALSRFRRLEAFRHFSHLEVALQTGRTHQIRVHVQHLGFPMVGDPVYGRRLAKKLDLAPAVREAVSAFPRQALHARRLRLRHPASGEAMTFEAPLPADLAELLDLLRAEDGA